MNCKICKKKISPKQVEDYTAIKVTYNGVNLYFCCQEHCKEYLDIVKHKKYVVESLDKIDCFVKNEIEIFNKMPILPIRLFTRINDLYNGTTRSSTRQIKNGTGKGYPYEVILETFIKCKDSINYFLTHKLADAKESQRVNYMMAIIEGEINNVYLDWLRVQKQQVNPVMEQVDYTAIKERVVSSTEKLFDESDLF